MKAMFVVIFFINHHCFKIFINVKKVSVTYYYQKPFRYVSVFTCSDGVMLSLPVRLSACHQVLCLSAGDVLPNHCLPVCVRLLHHLQSAGVQLLLPGVSSPDRREQPHLLWHVCLIRLHIYLKPSIIHHQLLCCRYIMF